VPWS